jgi:hypothetical protein
LQQNRLTNHTMKTPPTILLALGALLAVTGHAAEVTGVWTAEFDSQIGIQKYTFTLEQDGAKLTGKASSEVNGRTREAELLDGKVDGDRISFVELLSRAMSCASPTPEPSRRTK